jgi:hypothetical protein
MVAPAAGKAAGTTAKMIMIFNSKTKNPRLNHFSHRFGTPAWF